MGNCCCAVQRRRGMPEAASRDLNIGRVSHDASTSDSRGVSRSFATSSSGTASSMGDYSLKHSVNSGFLHPFSYSDLKAATRNFKSDCFLGEGGFGCVFKGWLNEHTFKATRPGLGLVVAVKKLNHEGSQGHREWLTELHYLGQLHHENLVKLIGFCAENDHRLLVYEFVSRGSLENHLFRRGSSHSLSWALRMNIAVGAARGLAFLHDAAQPVIYRDFKTSNILLDSCFNVKLSDFGLAKDGPIGTKSHVTTRVMGTYGYAAPEYLSSGHLTAKNDVYSFGVVLLELLTGRRAIDNNRPVGESNLVSWASRYLRDKRKVHRIMDPRVEGQYTVKDSQKVAAIALSCINTDSSLRPQMRDVVASLEPYYRHELLKGLEES